MGLRHYVQSQPARLRLVDRLGIRVAVLFLLSLILRQGFGLVEPLRLPISAGLGATLLVLLILRLFLDALVGGRFVTYLRTHVVGLVVLALFAVPWIGLYLGGLVLAMRLLLREAARALVSPRGRAFVIGVRRRPAVLIAGTFLFLIAIGTLFLSFPGSRAEGSSGSFLTALFTSASAVCVTGLIVVDTATHWSRFGQGVILALIQLGGLGIMTLSASAVLVLGKGFGAGSRGLLSGVAEEAADRDVKRFLQFIVAFTFLAEAVGALLLGLHWSRTMDPREAWAHAVFHSVSAFCNAGFSTFSTNLEAFPEDVVVNGTIGILIVLGGLGFPVAAGLAALARHPLRPGAWWRGLRTHARIVLTVNGLLLGLGLLLFLLFEHDRVLSGLGTGGKLLAAAFHSVSLRTAGFDTVPLAGVAPATALFMMFWMFIGGSPGGTAGGIKTTTLAVLFMSVASTVRRRPDVEIYHRRVPEETVFRAAATALLAGAIVFGVTVALLAVERTQDPMVILFEAVSAFGTVGLSLGATPELTPGGQLLIILLMFVGRTGPLTFAFILGQARRRFYRYPEARILVG